MKIEKPKSDNFLLSVAAQPETQRVVIESVARCTFAEELERTLEPLTFWAWDRGDVLCWAPVLNLFDDYLVSYIVKHRLGGPVCYQACLEALQNSAVKGDVTDTLLQRILHVTFLLLESCSSRAVYNSSELLIALLDSFNPAIVFSALQSLTLFHSCFRNKTRRQIDPRYSSELLLRIPFLCANPIRDLTCQAESSTDSENSYAALRINGESQNSVSQTTIDDGLDRRGQNFHRHRFSDLSEPSSSSQYQDVSMQEPMQDVSMQDDTPIQSPRTHSSMTSTDELGEIVSLYVGRIQLDRRILKTRHIRLQRQEDHDESMVVESTSSSRPLGLPRLNTKPAESVPQNSPEQPGFASVEIPYSELLGGMSPDQVQSMDMPSLILHQARIFESLATQHLGADVLTRIQVITDKSNSSPIEGQLQELRQKIRTLWLGCHPQGRQWLVDTRIAALCAILCLNSQFFLNCLMTCSTLLPDLALVLAHHPKIDKRTLCSILDLWTGILQEKVQHRSTIHLLGLSSPHGLFPSLFRKFLSSPTECEKPIPTLLSYASTDEEEAALQAASAIDTTTAGLPATSMARVESPTPEHSEATPLTNPASSLQSGSSPLPPGSGASSITSSMTIGNNSSSAPAISGRMNFDFRIMKPDTVESERVWMRKTITPEGVLPPMGNPLYEESDNDRGSDCARLRCRVLENLMEMYLAVVSTTISFTALSHTGQYNQ